MFTDLNVAPNVPNFATGSVLRPRIYVQALMIRLFISWEAGAFTSVSFSVPDNWKAGRIWVGIISGSDLCPN